MGDTDHWTGINKLKVSHLLASSVPCRYSLLDDNMLFLICHEKWLVQKSSFNLTLLTLKKMAVDSFHIIIEAKRENNSLRALCFIGTGDCVKVGRISEMINVVNTHEYAQQTEQIIWKDQSFSIKVIGQMFTIKKRDCEVNYAWKPEYQQCLLNKILKTRKKQIVRG